MFLARLEQGLQESQACSESSFPISWNISLCLLPASAAAFHLLFRWEAPAGGSSAFSQLPWQIPFSANPLPTVLTFLEQAGSCLIVHQPGWIGKEHWAQRRRAPG